MGRSDAGTGGVTRKPLGPMPPSATGTTDLQHGVGSTAGVGTHGPGGGGGTFGGAGAGVGVGGGPTGTAVGSGGRLHPTRSELEG